MPYLKDSFCFLYDVTRYPSNSGIRKRVGGRCRRRLDSAMTDALCATVTETRVRTAEGDENATSSREWYVSFFYVSHIRTAVSPRCRICERCQYARDGGAARPKDAVRLRYRGTVSSAASSFIPFILRSENSFTVIPRHSALRCAEGIISGTSRKFSEMPEKPQTTKPQKPKYRKNRSDTS